MGAELSRVWWALVIRGTLSILFGVLAFVFPGMTLEVLVILFGAYALVDGAMALVAAMAGARPGQTWALVVEGLFGIGAGVVTFLWPAITLAALLLLIAVWAIVTGVFEIVAAVRLRNEIQGEWALGLAGVLSILFGLGLFVAPNLWTLAVVYLIGAYALLFGVAMIALAMRLRSWQRGLGSQTQGWPGTTDRPAGAV